MTLIIDVNLGGAILVNPQHHGCLLLRHMIENMLW